MEDGRGQVRTELRLDALPPRLLEAERTEQAQRQQRYGNQRDQGAEADRGGIDEQPMLGELVGQLPKQAWSSRRRHANALPSSRAPEPAERRFQVERPVSGPLDLHHEATPSYWLLRSRRRRKIPAPISPRLARNVPSSEKPVNGSVFPCVVTAAATPELGPFDDGGVNADGVVVG